MSDIFSDLSYSDLLLSRAKIVQESAKLHGYPQDLSYLELMYGINVQKIQFRAGIVPSEETTKNLDIARKILLNYGISDSETALAHLHHLETALLVWRDRKAAFDQEMQSKLADLEHAFVKEYPLPFVSTKEVCNA